MQKIKAILAVAVVGFFVALIAFNATHAPSIDEQIWNKNLSKGVLGEGAQKHFIMYTDIFCPYCDKFSNALHANAADFENFLNDNKISYEMRVTDMNYVSGHSENSRPAGEAIYCAAKQEKFWDYYKAILDKVFADYHSKGIGVSANAEKIPVLELDYFYEAGEQAGVGNEALKTCMENHEALEELEAATAKTQRLTTGVPYFVFGTQKMSGFDGNWDTDKDYATAKRMLMSGL